MTFVSDDLARKATCPLIRICTNEAQVLRERVPAIYENIECKGADCLMGWRWGPAGERGGVGYCGAFGLPLCIVTPATGSEAL